MAQLTSPGVSVSVIDESFYTPAAPGTVPLIIVASAQDKTNASATGTAQGTTKTTAGTVWTITSQRDLSDTFGTPYFQTDANGNPVNGGELNEYGLQAAYSLLGVSSRAYVVRADINLSELNPSVSIPTGTPKAGTYWLDTGNSLFGIEEWDATNKVFSLKTPLVINDSNKATASTDMMPNQSFGSIGSYAIVSTSDNQAPVYYKNKDNNWVAVGSNADSLFGSSISGSTFKSTSWQSSFPVVTSTGFSNVSTGSSFTINSQSVTIGSNVTPAGVATSINALLPQYGVGAKVNAKGFLELYSDGSATNNGQVIIAGGAVASLGFVSASYTPVSLTIAPHTQVPQYGTLKAPNGSVYVKTTSPGKGASWIAKLYNGATKTWGTVGAPIYATSEAAIKAIDAVGGGTNIPVGTLFVESNFNHGTGTTGSPKLAEFQVWRRSAVSPTRITGANSTFRIVTGGHTGTYVYSFDIAETIPGNPVVQNTQTITVASVPANTQTVTTTVDGADIVTAISGAGLVHVSATLNDDGTISIKHALGGDIHLTDGTRSVLPTLGFTGYDIANKTGTANLYASGAYDSYTFRATNWKPLVFEAISSHPSTDPADGTLWYDANLEDVDIMYHNGSTWVGYKTAFPDSDPNGPQLASLAPTTQSDGTDLVNGDIWIDLADSDAYGQDIYVWNGTTLKWIKQDPTDQTSVNGWVFDDARWSDNGIDGPTYITSIKELLTSNYLDPDAPEPALYPQGTRLWNLRRSGFNIKRYEVGYIDINENDGKNARYQNDPMDGSNMTTAYTPNRWVSVSPNNADGSGTFGRHAQRAFVVKALKSVIDTNQKIRDTDTLIYNLIACPGYPEVVQNMVGLNVDRANTAFVIGDTPFRLAPTGTSLSNWGMNTAGALDNGDQGAVSYDDYMGFFYPSGYTNDNLGNYVVVPPSHMMLRTIAVSDQKAYPWFAPAGLRRGGVDNATSVGYLLNGEFKTTALPQSLRDVLYSAKINPIATLNGVGITNFGNLTRAKASSALDRINVARLVAYIRRQLGILSQPYLFEPNDSNTRNEIKSAIESLLLELVGLRGIYDYIVVCDESNNTPSRIDRNELWVDVAIEPVKAVEFIYIPMRLKNTGSIAAGNL
jgi:hypothetical protein